MKDLLRRNVVVRCIVVITVVAFISLSVVPSQALAQGALLGLSQPGVMVPLSPAFHPPMIYGIQVSPVDPFRFDFIMDTGDEEIKGNALRQSL